MQKLPFQLLKGQLSVRNRTAVASASGSVARCQSGRTALTAHLRMSHCRVGWSNFSMA